MQELLVSFSLSHHSSPIYFHNNYLKVTYIKNVHEFEDDNITLLLDDGEHTEPNKENMIAAYKNIVTESESRDTIFLHYSGHGTKICDDDHGEEDDG